MKKLSLPNWVQLVGKGRVKQLRDAAISTKKKKLLWITKYLDDNQIAELYYRVFENGEPLKKVARMVRRDWQVKPAWKLQQFVRGLETWKERLSTTLSVTKELAITPEDKKQIAKAEQAIAKLHGDVDVMKVLGGAIQMEAERIADLRAYEISIWERQKELAKAKGIPAPRMPVFTELDRMMVTLNTLCGQYSFVAMKTGATQVVPDEINVNIKAKSDFVLEHYVGRDGDRMKRAALRFLELAEQQAIDYSIDEKTGRFIPQGEPCQITAQAESRKKRS
jgi:hypothetical protein